MSQWVIKIFSNTIIRLALLATLAAPAYYATTATKEASFLLSSPPRIVNCGDDLGDQFLGTLGQRDTFLINLQLGDSLRIQMAFQNAGVNEQLELYDPNGNLLTTVVQTQVGMAVLEWPINQLGVYTIIASAAADNATGFYGVSFQVNNRPGCAKAVRCGDNLSSFFPLGGMEAFSLRGDQHDTLRVQLQLVDANKTPLLILFDPSGNKLVTLEGSPGETVILTYDDLPQSGNYTILVTEAAGKEGGIFGISFLLLQQDCARKVNCDSDISDAILSWAGMESYALEASAGDTLLVQMRYELDNIAPSLYLYHPNGSLLESIIGGAGSLGSLLYEGLPVDGSYLIIATANNNEIPGNFGISFQLLDAGTCATSFLTNSCEESVTAQISKLAEIDAYVFQGTANELVTFQLAVVSNNFDGRLRLFDPTGKLINEGSTGQLGPFQLPLDGLYTILIDERGGNTASFYTLSAQRIDPTRMAEREISICEGESFFVGGADQTAIGTYYDIIENNGACDSILITQLVRKEKVNINIVEAICFGDSIRVRDQYFSETGVFQIEVPNPNGCDTIYNLDLLLIEPVQSTINDTLCFGQSYTLGRVTYNQTGFYKDTLCDTIVSLTLYVLPPKETFIDTTLCGGQTITFGPLTLSTTGIYQQAYQTTEGCDSFVNLNLTVLDVIQTDIDQTICTGQWGEIGGVRYFETGSYSSMLITENGCDSLVNLNLTVLDTIQSDIDQTICTGQWGEIGGLRYFETGFYSRMLVTESGCDSLVNLNLTVLDMIQSDIDQTICTGQWGEIGGVRYFETGFYSRILETAAGCDSLVNLNLTVLPAPETTIDTVICRGEVVVIGNSRYDQTGVFTQLIEDDNECESFVTLILSVVDPSFTEFWDTICQGQSIVFQNKLYTQSGSFRDTIPDFFGCDSILQLNLTVYEVNETRLNITICEGDGYTMGDSTYTQSGDYIAVFPNSNNCDSTVFLHLEFIESVFTTLNIALCEGEGVFVGTNFYQNTGFYTDTLVSQANCDSIVSLNLIVNPNPSFIIEGDAALCLGESTSLSPNANFETYLWSNGSTAPSIAINTAGVFTLSVTDENGCTGVASKTVEVSQLATSIEAVEFPNGYEISCPQAADGQLKAVSQGGIMPYQWQWSNGSQTEQIVALGPGNYSLTVTDAFGCETVHSYALVAPPGFDIDVSVTPPLCVEDGGLVEVFVDGATGPYTFQVGANTQSQGLFDHIEAGSYPILVTDANGCFVSGSVDVPQAAFQLFPSFTTARITEGDSIGLGISANFTITKINWEPQRWLSCPDCPTPNARPEGSTIYTATVFAENGCALQASFLIEVGPFDGMFIPNGFSPNGDGLNDLYVVHADQRVQLINMLMIFDRWGNLLFEASDFPANDPAFSWDGTYRGKEASTGVYTYYTRITLQNGQTRVYQGDLTLLR
ncbi:MAG: gliding motility-associated C-terminal domain-containing protein [Saprospiraceae bacterium]